MADIVKVRLLIKGRVQGVFYRQSSCERAIALGLSGWVANQSDGSVTLEAIGPRAVLEDLILWCWQGPPAARVEQVEVSWSDIESDEAVSRPFRIIR